MSIRFTPAVHPQIRQSALSAKALTRFCGSLAAGSPTGIYVYLGAWGDKHPTDPAIGNKKQTLLEQFPNGVDANIEFKPDSSEHVATLQSGDKTWQVRYDMSRVPNVTFDESILRLFGLKTKWDLCDDAFVNAILKSAKEIKDSPETSKTIVVPE